MSTTTRPARRDAFGDLLAARDLALTTAAFVLGLATIIGAWGSQLFGGLVPCELCLEQRLAYYWGLPLLAAMLLLWKRLPRQVWFIAMAIATAIFVWGSYMGAYHAGVEWGFWPGPTACTGTGMDIDFTDLENINAAKVIPCDVVQFRFLGISLAGYNALISLAVVAMLGLAIWRRAQANAA